MAFYSHYWDSDPASVKRRRRGRFVFPILLFLFGLYAAVRQDGHWMWLVWFGGIALLCILIYPWLHRNGAKNHFAQFDSPDNENLFGRRTMELDDEKVIIVTDKVHESMLWSIFIRAFETPDYFFLYIAKQQAHIIPKRELSAAQIDELVSLLATHIPVYLRSENKKN